jgi:hypothetical protein
MDGIPNPVVGSIPHPPATTFKEWHERAGHPELTEEVLDQVFRYAIGTGAWWQEQVCRK